MDNSKQSCCVGPDVECFRKSRWMLCHYIFTSHVSILHFSSSFLGRNTKGPIFSKSRYSEWCKYKYIQSFNSLSNQVVTVIKYCRLLYGCFGITTYYSTSCLQKSIACSNFHLDCCWKVFLQVLAASDLATIRCPGLPSRFALQSQRGVLMHEGHKPSVSREGGEEPLPCPAAVCCLFTGRCHLAVCVCVLLRAMALDGKIGLPSSQDHKMTACWEHLAGTNFSHCRKPKEAVSVFARMCSSHCKRHESRGHVICSLIVMLKSLQKERWKIPNLVGHALRPADLFVCSC